MIKVTQVPLTAQGRLYPIYDEQEGLLVVRSSIRQMWPHSVNIDSLVICDLDAEGTLASVELLIPARRWQVKELPDRPQAQRTANLRFAPEIYEKEDFLMPVRVDTNLERSRVLILLGLATGRVDCIELSERCIALLNDNKLCGFDISLA